MNRQNTSEKRMEKKKFRPLVDKIFIISEIVCLLCLVAMTLLAGRSLVAIIIVFLVDAAVLYLLISHFFGYVELREETLFIKYGIFLKKEIAYKDIRKITKERKLYSDATVSLKCAVEHINIKYNSFDVTAVSVVGNDELIAELNARRASFE